MHVGDSLLECTAAARAWQHCQTNNENIIMIRMKICHHNPNTAPAYNYHPFYLSAKVITDGCGKKTT